MLWNAFVSKAKNSTFLFNRDFMEYHNDRFDDFSVLVFKNKKLIGILPANRRDDKLFSHQGLSYGCFVVLKKVRILDYINTFNALLTWLQSKGFSEIIIKQLPYIYNKHLAQEFEYILQKLDFKVVANNSYYVLDDLLHYKANRNRLRAIKKAETQMTLTKTGMAFFWEDILTKNLNNKFAVKPVHTLEEITALQERFPKEIKFYAAKSEDCIHAGVLLFISGNVVHFQYSSGREDRDDTGALDFLFDAIIKKYSKSKYISFGSAATDSTLKIDQGLAYWKESFGAHIMPQLTYAIKTDNNINLETTIK
ncbi:MAG: GNAT family N-acetyltransferase [Lacinutrix sp.]|uniref:GNAT family N-acetyltransferase n=1 Tax=Lacinutrix sp. TaxID=1937692 RepID=UPI00309A60D9